MPGVPITSIPDRLNTTLNDLNKGRITETYQYSDYVSLRLIWGTGGSADTIQGGTQWEKRIRMRASNQAKMTKLFEGTSWNRVPVTEVVKYDWRNIEDKSIVYDDRDTIFQQPPEAIIDEVNDVMKPAAEESFCNLLEDQTFGAPQNSSDDKSLAGLSFLCGWIPSGSATDYVGGFNGSTTYYADGTSTTTIGNIDCSLAKNRNFRSFVGHHSGFFDPVCRQTLRRALVVCNFKGIQGRSKDRSGRGQGRWVVFLNTTFALSYEDDANKSSDDLDGDLSKYNGQLYYRNVPLIRVEALDSNPYSPMIGVYTKYTYGQRAKNLWMYYSKPTQASAENNHMWVQPLDGTCVQICENRRGGIFNIHLPR